MGLVLEEIEAMVEGVIDLRETNHSLTIVTRHTSVPMWQSTSRQISLTTRIMFLGHQDYENDS
jgi:hypothetical protein